MRFAIFYDSRTGTTKAAAEDMAQIARAAGHACSVEALTAAAPTATGEADVVCVGSWTDGLFVAFQRATKATMRFIDGLSGLEGKTAAVFCTYKLATGRMLPRMTEALGRSGANVTGQFRSKGPKADDAFADWVSGLGG